MSALQKKENLEKVDLAVNENSTNRPNIDHLIKRIESQRKRERRNSIIIGIAFFGLAIVVYFFTKS
jgi:t-SNARE complex subunit (syntaxin)